MLTEPSRPLMRRTMFLSSNRCLYSSDTSPRCTSHLVRASQRRPRRGHIHAGKAKGDARLVRVNVPARCGLKGRSGSNWSGLERRRCRDGGHRRPRGRRLTAPTGWVCGPDEDPSNSGSTRASAAIAATTLCLVSAQPKPVNKRHVAVTGKGSGIVAVACDSITHVGLNGTISCVIGIGPFGLRDRGCRGQRCTCARQRSSTNTKRFQFRRGGRCLQRGCDARLRSDPP